MLKGSLSGVGHSFNARVLMIETEGATNSQKEFRPVIATTDKVAQSVQLDSSRDPEWE